MTTPKKIFKNVHRLKNFFSPLLFNNNIGSKNECARKNIKK